MVTTQRKQEPRNYIPESIASIAAGGAAAFAGWKHVISQNTVSTTSNPLSNIAKDLDNYADDFKEIFSGLEGLQEKYISMVGKVEHSNSVKNRLKEFATLRLEQLHLDKPYNKEDILNAFNMSDRLDDLSLYLEIAKQKTLENLLKKKEHFKDELIPNLNITKAAHQSLAGSDNFIIDLEEIQKLANIDSDHPIWKKESQTLIQDSGNYLLPGALERNLERLEERKKLLEEVLPTAESDHEILKEMKTSFDTKLESFQKFKEESVEALQSPMEETVEKTIKPLTGKQKWLIVGAAFTAAAAVAGGIYLYRKHQEDNAPQIANVQPDEAELQGKLQGKILEHNV